MAYIQEIKYFNSFVLKKTQADPDPSSTGTAQKPINVWNGSRGIPQAIGGYSVVAVDIRFIDRAWFVEEARIRAGYNNTSTDYGVRAYLVEDEPNAINRFNSLIYSGIFNSRTGINNTNVFSVAEDITKSLDPANGGIQKLYAEDTNLSIFQERKVSRALIDKDAIYSAEGGGTVTSSNLVIGAIQPYLGNFGMGDHPESFASYGYKKYFVDTYQNVVLRLDRNGLFPISSYGLISFFRNQISGLDNAANGKGKVIGGFDIYNKEYVVSLQPSNPSSVKSTLTFDERSSGWNSFYSYIPDQIFSLKNNFYTTKEGSIWRHYSQNANVGNFYGTSTPSSVTFVFNPSPSTSKNFSTINYEGTNGWQVNSIISDATGAGIPYATDGKFVSDTSSLIYSYTQGAYDNAGNIFPSALTQPVSRAGFDRKENKYCANIINNTLASEGEVIFGQQVSGIKGFFATVTMSTDTVTDVGNYKELFAVSSSFSINYT